MAAPVVMAPIIAKLAALLGSSATASGSTAAATAGTAAASKAAGTAATKAGGLASKMFTGLQPNTGLVDMFPKMGKLSTKVGKGITPKNINTMATGDLTSMYNALGNGMGSSINMGDAMTGMAKNIQGTNISNVNNVLNSPGLKNFAFNSAGNYLAKQTQDENQEQTNPYGFQGGGFSSAPINTIDTGIGDIPLIGSLIDPLAIKMKSKSKGNEMQAIDKNQLSSSTSNPFGSFKKGGKAYKNGGFSMESSMVDEINEMSIKKMLKRKK